MNANNTRRKFFKQLFAFSTFSAGSMLSFKRMIGANMFNLDAAEAHAMDNPDYDPIVFPGEIRIRYKGFSCFLIITGNGTRIITDPCSGLGKEPADIVTVSCGHYFHCTVDSVGGFPYLYKRTEPAKIGSIPFRGVATRHLEINDGQKIRPGENYVICFEAEGITVCHLGALGHPLSDGQVKQIGNVDILMVPVGGVNTLPVSDAVNVCRQLNPSVIIPMNYPSGQSRSPKGETVDEFLKRINNGGNVQQGFMGHGLGAKSFKKSELPSRTQVMVL